MNIKKWNEKNCSSTRIYFVMSPRQGKEDGQFRTKNDIYSVWVVQKAFNNIIKKKPNKYTAIKPPKKIFSQSEKYEFCDHFNTVNTCILLVVYTCIMIVRLLQGTLVRVMRHGPDQVVAVLVFVVENHHTTVLSALRYRPHMQVRPRWRSRCDMRAHLYAW